MVEENKQEIDLSKIVVFSTKEGITVHVEREYAEYSPIVKGMLDDLSTDAIPLLEITKVTFDKVLEYIKHVKQGNAPPEIQKPLPSNDLRDVTTDFYASFIEGTDEEI